MIYDHLKDNQIYKKKLVASGQQGNEQNKKTISEVSKHFNQAQNRLFNNFFASASNFMVYC